MLEHLAYSSYDSMNQLQIALSVFWGPNHLIVRTSAQKWRDVWGRYLNTWLGLTDPREQWEAWLPEGRTGVELILVTPDSCLLCGIQTDYLDIGWFLVLPVGDFLEVFWHSICWVLSYFLMGLPTNWPFLLYHWFLQAFTFALVHVTLVIIHCTVHLLNRENCRCQKDRSISKLLAMQVWRS